MQNMVLADAMYKIYSSTDNHKEQAQQPCCIWPHMKTALGNECAYLPDPELVFLRVGVMTHRKYGPHRKRAMAIGSCN